MSRRYICELGSVSDGRKTGGKSAGLRSLSALGLAIPTTYVCSCEAQLRHARARDATRISDALRGELEGLVRPSGAYAVRSSAAGEDGASASMAGQFASFLSVTGVDRIVEAILRVWTSDGWEVKSYRSALDVEPSRGGIEVLIQEMVPGVCAGASFSRNPVTGAEEIIVEAVEGTSEALLQGGVTPHRWVLGDSEVVSDWPKLPSEILREIGTTTRRVAASLSYPADLEWAYDGTRLWWLQVRPITSLRGLPVYSNRISREYLPGLVKPLVWSINVPMINGAWVDLFERLVGPLAIDPLSLAKQFHYRAYFNMSGMGGLFRKLGLAEDTLEQLFGLVPSVARSPFGFRWKMLRHLSRLVGFAASMLGYRRRLQTWVEKMDDWLEEESGRLARVETVADRLAWVEGCLPVMREAAGQRIVSLLLHLAVGQLGRRLVQKKRLGHAADLEREDRRLEIHDPQVALRQLAANLFDLPPAVRGRAKDLSYGEFFELDGTESLRGEMEIFLKRFGYISESGNDFSTVAWSEDPTLVLRLIDTVALSPSAVRKASVGPRDRRVARWARRVTDRRVDHERAGAVLSRGFHLLRLWARGLGRTLADLGFLASPDDVFFFSLDELQSSVLGDIEWAVSADRAEERKREMRAAQTVVLPEMILGEYAGRCAPRQLSSQHLAGVAASRGVYEGPVCVVRTIHEFGLLNDGDVLVVPFSDVAWTPLFARAGAIVAEAGGMLSHSSIVAREFGVPAVVSVANACTRLAGARVRVNGYEGTVRILGALRSSS